jgi:sugar phosphate isomerase/epimerase
VRLCFNQVTAGRRAPADPARDLAAVREGGWEAVELWLPHWEGAGSGGGAGPAAAVRRQLDTAGLAAAGACAQAGLFFSEGEARQMFREECERRLELCAAVGAPHLVIVPGTPGAALPERPSADDLQRAAENLRHTAERAARHGVRLGIEFLKGARLVSCLPTALALARRVAHPQVGVLVDTFHLYAGVSKVEDLHALRATPDLLTFVHLNDVPAASPRELWTDADRVLPGAGDLPLTDIVAALRGTGYGGYVSLELFNEAFATRWQDDPVGAARSAYEATAPLILGPGGDPGAE